MIEPTDIAEIENEYKRIDHKWLRLQFKTAVGVVLFVFLFECFMGVALCATDAITTTVPRYLFKYLLAPTVLNAGFVAMGHVAMHSPRLKQKVKEYAISLLFVLISFVVYSVHSIFASTYLVFTIPVILTIVYSNYTLTSVVAVCSISAMIGSAVFVNWDPDRLSIMASSITFANFIVSIFVLVVFHAICIIVIRFEKEKNAASIQKEMERHHLKWRVQVDELTNINNRIALRNEFQSMEVDMQNSYIFAMLDIDNFKMLNDNLGHTQGDICLKEFGSILTEHCSNAIPFRFGGDEFCILFKNRTLKAVIEVCENMQEAFQDISVIKATDLPVSVSFGIAHYSKEMSVTQLIKNTDIALYRSKSFKNAISVYEGT